ncbi:MAG: helix-turn-helix domain-containing protein, partial [Candidatus Limnocylindria bacterium]
RRYLDRILDELPPEDGLLTSARRAIGDLMRQGEPKLGPVANRLAIGPRTLQRRLKEQGADFKALVDDTRRRFSLRYLQDRKNTLTEVAYLLGYSEVSAFNRASSGGPGRRRRTTVARCRAVNRGWAPHRTKVSLRLALRRVHRLAGEACPHEEEAP